MRVVKIGELRARTADDDDVARARTREHVGDERAAARVVGAHLRDVRAEIAVEGDDRTPDRRPIVAVMRGVRGDDERVEAALAQHLDVLRFAVRGVDGRAQHGAQ